VARLEAAEGSVVIKWFGWRHRVHALFSPFRKSRAWRTWNTAQELERMGVSTPAPRFAYTRRCMGFVRENFFISSAIHPHQRLRTLLRSETSMELIEKAVSNLAISIARMHDGGIIHRDLTSGNFLVDEEGRVYLTDLNRAHLLDYLSVHQRLRDLARISFTMSDDAKTIQLAKTFFHVYGVETSEEADWEKGYWNYRRHRLKKRRLKLRLKRLLRR
jgi:tRNA A-37 threonylcarbamoyl transferase component Bud32